MNREKLINKFDEDTGYFINTPIEVLHLARYNFILLVENLELYQKENTRLKKQLSKDYHHIECGCSFCKPLSWSYVDNSFTFTSCDDCKNKIDGTYQEICSNCKRFYGCYFEAKEKLC